MDPVELPSNPDENGAVDILASTVLVITLASIVVLARVYVRLFMIRNIGWDVSCTSTSSRLFSSFFHSRSFFFPSF
jgi:hypothetical protein